MSKESQFIKACKNNKIEIIKKLVYEGVNIHESNDAGFKWACCTGCIEIVIYLTTLHQITFTNGYKNSELDRHKGDVLYIENRAPITRASDQTENIKLVIEF